MNGLLKGCVLVVVITAAIAREIKVDWASDRIQARNNGRLRSLTFGQNRNLQDVNCDFLPHGRALSCTEQTASGNNVRYSVTCPAGVTTVEECLQDQSRICYQFNSFPCIGSFFCASTNRFSLDCGNLFASSNGNTCSATDCTGNCTELLDATVNYNAVDLDNDCFRLGLSSTQNCDSGPCIVTTEWNHVLSSSTQILVTGTRNSNNNVFETCQVTVAGQSGSSCPCNVNCPAATNAISYDCTDFSTDACAAIDCSGNCLPNGFPPVIAPVPVPTTVAVPVNVPPTIVVTPVVPPVQATPVLLPVTPPVNAPAAVPVTPVAVPPVKTPVAVPVQVPIVVPVKSPVQAPVAVPVTPVAVPPVALPVVTPVKAPIFVPVTLPVQAPVAVPVAVPVVIPVKAPVFVPVTPPVQAPVVVPVAPVAPPVTLTNGTVCDLWWGLY